ncbi:hypothetical protein L2E82_01873 [Cichorium intybus]|uniref:Uncharacterized protein n=1 Tax=Cichorium intybus TaxID=13427 RepID=A0ACB9H1D5_CICIN|nr:hypothetical protein L2E82_01873 [Cichorium intybus]
MLLSLSCLQETIPNANPNVNSADDTTSDDNVPPEFAELLWKMSYSAQGVKIIINTQVIEVFKFPLLFIIFFIEAP